jgi:hypothetical protein
MPYAGKGRAAPLATIPEYSNVACIFFSSLIEDVSVHNAFQVVVNFAETEFKLGKWEKMVKPKHTYSDLTDLKKAALKYWKRDTTLFYVCVESVIKYTITEENNLHLYSLKMLIDTMCVLLDDKDIQEDIGTTLIKGLFEKQRIVNAILDKKRDDEERMQHQEEMIILKNAKQQQRDLTPENCLDDKKLYDLLQTVSLSLDKRLRQHGQPINDVPDFPYARHFGEHEGIYPLFEEKNGKFAFVDKRRNGLTAKQDGQSLVVKDSMNCKVIQEIGSDVCCVHYKSCVVKHELPVHHVYFGKSADVFAHRIYIQVNRFEIVSPECFFVRQKCPDLYAMAKDVYRDSEEDLD